VLGSAIPRAPSATDVKPWQSQPLRRKVSRDRESRSGHAETPEVSAGRAKPQAPLRLRPLGIRQARFTEPGSKSHRLAGSWANDHGVAAHLSCNASTRVNVLTIVSAIRQAVLACAAGRGWPDLRLRELRVCAYLACEIHGSSLARASLLRKARGVTPLAESRFAPANHSAHCSGSSAPAAPKARGRHQPPGWATTAKAFGQAVSLRTRANRLRFVTRIAEASRTQLRSRAKLARSTAFGQSARDATTRSVTVASATVRLPGRKAW
jgi:hypothetical protein